MTFKRIDLGNGQYYTSDQLNTFTTPHFVAGYNGQPFTGKQGQSRNLAAHRAGQFLRYMVAQGEKVVRADGEIVPAVARG